MNPVKTDLSPVPESILQSVRSQCKVTNKSPYSTRSCSCRKNGFICVLACGNYHGEQCQNCEVLPRENDTIEKDERNIFKLFESFYVKLYIILHLSFDFADYLFKSLYINLLVDLVMIWNWVVNYKNKNYEIIACNVGKWISLFQWISKNDKIIFEKTCQILFKIFMETLFKMCLKLIFKLVWK